MDLLARIDEVDARNSTLVGDSTVSMSGRAATFGGRMMNSVADQVLKQFADNFSARVGEIEAARAAGRSGSAASAGGRSCDRPRLRRYRAPPRRLPS